MPSHRITGHIYVLILQHTVTDLLDDVSLAGNVVFQVKSGTMNSLLSLHFIWQLCIFTVPFKVQVEQEHSCTPSGCLHICKCRVSQIGINPKFNNVYKQALECDIFNLSTVLGIPVYYTHTYTCTYMTQYWNTSLTKYFLLIEIASLDIIIIAIAFEKLLICNVFYRSVYCFFFSTMVYIKDFLSSHVLIGWV